MAEDEKQEILAPETPSEITPENMHLVDFDNLRVRILCLISVPNAFTIIENYLNRRGWEVLVMTEMKDALTQVGIFQPDFVLVSVNHPHKKIKQFPNIIMQTFNVPTITFGEKSDSKTMGALQSARSTHKIMGHLSGPTAQRKIKQILQEMYKPEEEGQETSKRSFKTDTNEKQTFKVSAKEQEKQSFKFEATKNKKQGAMIFEKNQSSMSRADGYSPFKGGGSQSDAITKSTGTAYTPTQERKEEIKLSMAEKIQKDKDDMAKAMQELSSAIGTGNLDQGKDKAEPSLNIESKGEELAKSYGSADKQKIKNDKPIIESSGASSHQHSIKQEGTEIKSVGSTTGDMGTEQEDSGVHIQKKDSYTMDSDYTPKAKKEAPVMESDYIAKNKNRTKISEADNQTFIEKSAIEIVSKMKAEDHENPTGLGVVSRVALLSVGHDKHKGYFMIAGHDIGMNLDDFVQEFTEHFKKVCMEAGEAMEFGDYINMDCPGYDFFDNGEEGLEFNFVSNFGAGEIGIKFINDEEAWAHAEIPENHEKALIKTEQVVPDQPLEMDLFVHLERNQKYYKIVGEGSELSTDRKDRLTEKETEVFINEDDVGTYRSYQTKQKALKVIDGTVKRTTKKKAS